MTAIERTGLLGERPTGELDVPNGMAPVIDADLYLPALLDGFLGSKTWMAARMGQVGGRATTQAKQAAARANGRLGGRPRKKAVA